MNLSSSRHEYSKRTGSKTPDNKQFWFKFIFTFLGNIFASESTCDRVFGKKTKNQEMS